MHKSKNPSKQIKKQKLLTRGNHVTLTERVKNNQHEPHDPSMQHTVASYGNLQACIFKEKNNWEARQLPFHKTQPPIRKQPLIVIMEEVMMVMVKVQENKQTNKQTDKNKTKT